MLASLVFVVPDAGTSAVVGKQRQANGCRGCLLDDSESAVLIHVRRSETRIGCIHFDAGTFQLLSTAEFSADADNIRYDARGHRAIVGYGDGALAFLDSNGKKTGEIPLDGHFD